MSGNAKCCICRVYWFECDCHAQADTRRMAETGTGSGPQGPGSAVHGEAGDAP